jgi:hypothetical protein
MPGHLVVRRGFGDLVEGGSSVAGLGDDLVCGAVALPTPWRAAIARVDHCVEPSSGTELRVSATMASTISVSTRRLRPRPDAIVPTAATRPARYLARQRRTVLGHTWRQR